MCGSRRRKSCTSNGYLGALISREGVTGWSIGNSMPSSPADDAKSLYEKLESRVVPLYRSGMPGWVTVMKSAIGKNAAYFNSHRMMRRYATEAYIR